MTWSHQLSDDDDVIPAANRDKNYKVPHWLNVPLLRGAVQGWHYACKGFSVAMISCHKARAVGSSRCTWDGSLQSMMLDKFLLLPMGWIQAR